MNAHPLPYDTNTKTSIYTLLSEDQAGCGAFGPDTGLSWLSGSYAMKDFMTDNSAMFTTARVGQEFNTFYSAST